MKPPFDLDKYEYQTGGYYDAFKRDVDEKICAAMVSETLADSLRKHELVYNTKGSVAVADIGCGPADSIQMYLGGARHAGGFDIHATDYSKDYTGENGMAQKNLTIAKASGKLKINNFSVTNGDAFGGNMTATLGTEANQIPLAFISHMFYHTDPAHVERLMQDVAHNVLADQGVAVSFHLKKVPGTFQHFRSKFGRKSVSEGTSDTPAMEVDNPPQSIEDACKKQGIACHTVDYSNNYYFAPMKDENWEKFKHPEQYGEITDKAALDNLRKLHFITQRAANEFAADKGANGLSAFIDEVRTVIAPDRAAFEKEGGLMPLAETVQLIGGAGGGKELDARLKLVAEDIKAKMPELEAKAFRQWQKRSAMMEQAA